MKVRMKFRVKIRSLVVMISAVMTVMVILYIFAPLWLMGSRAYASLASFLSLSPYSPRALLHAAEAADPTPGSNRTSHQGARQALSYLNQVSHPNVEIKQLILTAKKQLSMSEGTGK